MNQQFPCKCGHSWELHKDGLYLIDGQSWITGCNADIHYGDFCIKYVPDNLRYLEYKYETTKHS